jgi:hypothetical protein
MRAQSGDEKYTEGGGRPSRPAPTSLGWPILAGRAGHPPPSGRRAHLACNRPNRFRPDANEPKGRTGKPLFQSAQKRTRTHGPSSPTVLMDGMASPVCLNGPSRRGHFFIVSCKMASAPGPSPQKTGSPGFVRNKPALTREWVASGLTAVEFLAAASLRARG